jgi:hypothetical protein
MGDAMNEKQLQKLIKQNSEKAERAKKQKPGRAYDSTLVRKEAENEDIEREEFFDEMKRREF